MIITVSVTPSDDGREEGGHHVAVNGHPLGFRPYDGSWADDVEAHVIEAFAAMLRDRLGWSIDVNAHYRDLAQRAEDAGEVPGE